MATNNVTVVYTRAGVMNAVNGYNKRLMTNMRPI